MNQIFSNPKDTAADATLRPGNVPLRRRARVQASARRASRSGWIISITVHLAALTILGLVLRYPVKPTEEYYAPSYLGSQPCVAPYQEAEATWEDHEVSVTITVEAEDPPPLLESPIVRKEEPLGLIDEDSLSDSCELPTLPVLHRLVARAPASRQRPSGFDAAAVSPPAAATANAISAPRGETPAAITSSSWEPGIITRCDPIYPRLARRLGQEGAVRLTLTIAIDGSVSDVVIEHSSGIEALDEAAIAAVRTWRFSARPPDTSADLAQVALSVVFRLTG